MNTKESIKCDVLVIGGGGAGLWAAIAAREAGAEVLVISKSRIGYGNNTYISKATFAASGVGNPEDNAEIHLKDTLSAGRFINDRDLAHLMTKESGPQVSLLKACGVSFFEKDRTIHLEQAPGHSLARHVRGKNRTGSDLIFPMKRHGEKLGIRFMDKVFITRLLSSDNRIAGAVGTSKDGQFRVFLSKAVILTTGGFAQVFLRNNNAAGITGDGHALAFELGVPLKDMEFVQFYPTARGPFGNRLILYEALIARAGGLLLNSKGEDIIAKHQLKDPDRLTRDRLSRCLMYEINEGRDVDGGVIMDLGPIPPERLEHLKHMLPSGNIDQKRLVVSPTTHFCMGGIIVNPRLETSIPGLYAAGEVTAGVHGANRLAGNALAEVFAMGGLAGKHAALSAKELPSPSPLESFIDRERKRMNSLHSGSGRHRIDLWRALKEVMWHKTGVIRSREGLEKALAEIQGLKAASRSSSIRGPKELIRFLEFQNMLLISEMVTRAAIVRQESRGSHWREDYPEEDDEKWLSNIYIYKENHSMRLEKIPILKEAIKPLI
jgi:succinate dehydrogenase/fumarate reductase flavoprotein subunit